MLTGFSPSNRVSGSQARVAENSSKHQVRFLPCHIIIKLRVTGDVIGRTV